MREDLCITSRHLSRKRRGVQEQMRSVHQLKQVTEASRALMNRLLIPKQSRHHHESILDDI